MSKIFGHSWEAIQRAQQGGRLHDRLPAKAEFPQCTDADIQALAEFGADGLKERGFFGTIDRLTRAGIPAFAHC